MGVTGWVGGRGWREGSPSPWGHHGADFPLAPGGRQVGRQVGHQASSRPRRRGAGGGSLLCLPSGHQPGGIGGGAAEGGSLARDVEAVSFAVTMEQVAPAGREVHSCG